MPESSVTDVIMPSLGMAETDGVLVRWCRGQDEEVAAGDVIAEVDTDKTIVEVQCPVAGRLTDLRVQVGQTVPSGSVIARVVGRGGGSADTATPSGAGAWSSPSGAGQNVTERPTPEGSAAVPAPTTVDGWAAVPVPPMTLPDVTFGPIELAGTPVHKLAEWLEAMELIREFERVSSQLALQGKIPGGMHSSAGQEAVAVGTIRALGPDDVITSSHRSHHHALCKGLTPREVMAELYGKRTGCLGGRAGHMHLADLRRNLYGSNGVVGGGLGIALGVALSFRLRDAAAVAVGFFGDGGANTGRIWEFVNLAALWRLPLIVVCENNQYAVETHVSRAMAGESIASRAAGFGLPAVRVDGQDVASMYRATADARARALRGDGPTFIEALTYRYEGHNTGDDGAYRTAEEITAWRLRDPIDRFRDELLRLEILGPPEVEAIQQDVARTVADAVAFAERSEWPAATEADRGVTSLAGQAR